MQTRAKFKLETVKQYANGAVEVEFTAVNDKINEEWSKWTPSGRLIMTINNETATKGFVLGKEYYLDITEAE